MREWKKIERQLLKQYQEDTYGKLHRALQDAGVQTDLYVGIGIEMYYPSEEEKEFGLNVFDFENLVLYFKQQKRLRRESDKKLKVATQIARKLGYQVRSFDALSEKELQRLGFN